MSARTVSIDLDPRTRARFDKQLGGRAPAIGAHCSKPTPPPPPTKPDPCDPKNPKDPISPPTKPDEDDG